MKLTQKYLIYSAIVVAAVLAPIAHTVATTKSNHDDTRARMLQAQQLPEVLASIVPPSDEKPQWHKDQVAAEAQAHAAAVAQSQAAARAAAPRGASRVVTYTVSSKGAIGSNLAEFAAQANQTLNDPRGWARLGVSFQQVRSGGDFDLILSEAALLPTFSSGCDSDWSCRAGRSVIINDDRWRGATTAWNNAGGGIRDYRHMVVNHEVGHWLGHDHEYCGAAGGAAPVMQQQSMSLQGCTFNPWPLTSEVWSSALGIR